MFNKQSSVLFTVVANELVEGEAIIVTDKESGINVHEMLKICSDDSYNPTICIDLSESESADKLYFTKCNIGIIPDGSDYDKIFVFVGGQADGINGINLFFDYETNSVSIVPFAGSGGGGVTVMSREEWNAVEKKNEYGLVAVMDYDDRYIAGSLYNGAYYVEGFLHAYFDNDIFITDNFETDTLPLFGNDDGGKYFNNSTTDYFSGHLRNAYPISANEKLILEFRLKINRYNTTNFYLEIGNNAGIDMSNHDVRIYNANTQVFYLGFDAIPTGTIKKFKFVFSESERKLLFSIDDGEPTEYSGGTVIDFYNNLKNNELIKITNTYGRIYYLKLYHE